jgi:hypothetical protein
MRFLSLRRRALINLISVNPSSFNVCPTAAMTIYRDTGVSILSILQKLVSGINPLNKSTHFFHYKHECGGKLKQDLWIYEKDIPDSDGKHFICLECQMFALKVITTPQQKTIVQLGGTAWPP